MDQYNYQAINDPRLNNSNQFMEASTSSTTQNNQQWNFDDDANIQFINTWLMERGKFQLPTNYLLCDMNQKLSRKSRQISINFAKHSIQNCLLILQKMSATQEELHKNVETMSTMEWKQKSLEIGSLRDEFDKLLMRFEDKDGLNQLKTTIKRRLKKRINQKRKKQFLREQYSLKQQKRLIRHNQIDKWLENKKEETEKIKMEEKSKKDADCVLYEVSRKKTEARKHLSLISALVKLRTVRDNMATQRGEKLSLEDRQAFGSVTEKLIRTWENCYQNYCKEEQNLRTKLEQQNATIDTETLKLTRCNEINLEWEQVLFGYMTVNDLQQYRNNPTYWALTSADRDLETFIAIRRSWDTFLNHTTNDIGNNNNNNNSNNNGTSIPIGWILPPLNPNEKWGKYARNMTI